MHELFFYFFECALYSLIGFTSGIIINIIIKKSKNYISNEICLLLLNLFLLISVVFIIEKYINKNFAKNWQSITPGLFFISFYFITQFEMQKLINSIFLEK